jgi:predicted secreted protein
MKSKIFSLVTVLCALVLMPANLWAGDYSNLQFIGFSRDGKYLAFEEYGTGDASGFPFASVYFVEVEKNAFAGKPFDVTIEKDGATEEAAIKKVEALAARKMRQLKIVRGNTGKLVLAHLLTDWTYEDSFARVGDKAEKIKLNDYINPNSPNQYEFYELTLNSIPTKTNGVCQDEYYTFYKLELALDHINQGKKDMDTQILQKDADLPKRRGCPYGYRMESVYSYKNKIAVFVNVFSQGWEGPDMRYMVVTANWQRYF